MTNTFVEPAEVTVFLERVLADGGMANVEPEVREQMLKDLRSRLENKLFATLVMKLPENDLPAFNALVERKAPQEQIQEFLKTKIPNLDEVLAEAMLEFRRLYVKE